MGTAYPAALDTKVATGNLPTIGEAIGQETTVDGAHSASETAFTVASTAAFGATGTLVLGGANPERVTYASKTGTIFTLDVGLANDKADGDAVVCVPTGKDWNSIGDAIVAMQTASGTEPRTVGKTVAPTVNDDSGDGYSVGSHWYDETNDKAYVALDVTVGAAVWLEITAGGPLTVYPETVANVANTTTKTAIIQFTMPDGEMADGNMLEIIAWGVMKNNSGGTAWPILELDWGGTTAVYHNPGAGTWPDSATEGAFATVILQCFRSGSNLYVMGSGGNTDHFIQGRRFSDGWDDPDMKTIAPTFTGSAQTVKVNITLSTANAAMYVNTEFAIITRKVRG